MLTVTYAECHYGECHYADYRYAECCGASSFIIALATGVSAIKRFSLSLWLLQK
jgi:hypothetical protein